MIKLSEVYKHYGVDHMYDDVNISKYKRTDQQPTLRHMPGRKVNRYKQNSLVL